MSTTTTPDYDVTELKEVVQTSEEKERQIHSGLFVSTASQFGEVSVHVPVYPTYENKQRLLALAKGVTNE